MCFKFIVINTIVLELILFNLLLRVNKLTRYSLFKNQTLKRNSLYSQLGAYWLKSKAHCTLWNLEEVQYQSLLQEWNPDPFKSLVTLLLSFVGWDPFIFRILCEVHIKDNIFMCNNVCVFPVASVENLSDAV